MQCVSSVGRRADTCAAMPRKRVAAAPAAAETAGDSDDEAEGSAGERQGALQVAPSDNPNYSPAIKQPKQVATADGSMLDGEPAGGGEEPEALGPSCWRLTRDLSAAGIGNFLEWFDFALCPPRAGARAWP